MAQTVELEPQPDEPRETSPSGSVPNGPRVDPLIGKQLLHYTVVEVIGQGGMSVVYRGHDANLRRDVAIKVLHPFLAEKAECRARLAREARAVARLEHPHILKVFDFSGDPPTLDEHPQGHRARGFAEGFIVCELVRGCTLKRFAETHALWQCPELGALVVWQLADALRHAHEHGVIHRDLKPENVMVRDDGWLKLMDFGIAHIVDQKGLTVTGTLLGSPAHMAPECIDGFAADERSDVFSLGTVLYWLATGQLPFEAHSPHALLKQIAEGRVVPAQQRNPRVSDDLARVIARSMATNPDERTPTAAALCSALAELLDHSGVPADSPRLRQLLADPATEIPLASAATRRAHLARAEQLLAQGAPARALACIGRVLADDNDDADARALLERAEHERGTVDDVELAPAAPAPSAALAASPAASELRASAWRRALRQAALWAMAVALVVAAVVVALRFDPAPAAPLATNETVVPVAPVDDGIELETAMTPASTATTAAQPPSHAPQRVPEGTLRPPTRAGVGATTPPAPPSTNPGVTQRRVTLFAKPWADIFIDGQKVASGMKVDVDIAVGHHTVSFRAPRAKDEVREIDVPAEGVVPEISARLRPQPAYLVVKCNVPDALVQVGDQGAMPAADTQRAAITVPLDEGQQKIEVTVVKQGYTTVVRPVTFQADRTQTLDVVLIREPDAAAPR